MQSIFQSFVINRQNIVKLRKLRAYSTIVYELVDSPTLCVRPNNIHVDQNVFKQHLADNSTILPRKNSIDKAKMSLIHDFQKLESKLAGIRHWENVDDYNKLMGNGENVPFTLLSYNILAQNLLESHMYLYDRHDRRALTWKHRKSRLQQEILSIQPHILCIQEVQESHLNELKVALRALNLSVLYKKRTGFKDDGCAIFYNNKMFNLVEHHSVEYYQPQVQILNRENVAVVAKLSLKRNESIQFVVATTHLLYNPRRQDVRLAQIQVLLAELDRLALAPDNTYLPVILTGDLNLQPYSAPYKLLTRGSLEYEGLKAKTLENIDASTNTADKSGKILLPPTMGITDNCQHAHVASRNIKKDTSSSHSEMQFSTGKLSHCFNFTSVYHHHVGSKEQEASTFQNQWVTVDYIFYSCLNASERNSQLNLLSRYKLPSVEQCARINMIPNLYFGSDHLALAAKFIFS